MPAWLPTALVILLAAMALAWAASPPVTAKGRRLCMASVFILGTFAIAGAVWQSQHEADEAPALAGASASPISPQTKASGPSSSVLAMRVKALEDYVKELEAGRRARTINQATADDLASYLKQFGTHSVIVSCIPDDIEAYLYANRIVNILKAADWEAQGPEVTKIFGEVRAPGINVYVNGDAQGDTAKVLLDGFATFNIPYQSRVTPPGAIPDSEPVELFIGSQPSARSGAGAG